MTFKNIMFQLLDKDYEVACNTIMRGCIALTLHGQLHSILHTRWNIDSDNLIALDNAVAMTVMTFIFNNTTFATTVRACTLGLHHA